MSHTPTEDILQPTAYLLRLCAMENNNSRRTCCSNRTLSGKMAECRMGSGDREGCQG